MIKITLVNGDVKKWAKNEYTEYDIKGKFFVVIYEDQWVGIYAIDQIVCVEVERE